VSSSGSGNGTNNGKSGNGAMDVRDGIIDAAVIGSILAGVAALLV